MPFDFNIIKHLWEIVESTVYHYHQVLYHGLGEYPILIGCRVSINPWWELLSSSIQIV